MFLHTEGLLFWGGMFFRFPCSSPPLGRKPATTWEIKKIVVVVRHHDHDHHHDHHHHHHHHHHVTHVSSFKDILVAWLFSRVSHWTPAKNGLESGQKKKKRQRKCTLNNKTLKRSIPRSFHCSIQTKQTISKSLRPMANGKLLLFLSLLWLLFLNYCNICPSNKKSKLQGKASKAKPFKSSHHLNTTPDQWVQTCVPERRPPGCCEDPWWNEKSGWLEPKCPWFQRWQFMGSRWKGEGHLEGIPQPDS